MPTNVKRYQLLISCPGDVIEEVQIIKDAVSKFNSTFTDTLDIMIQTRHWAKDAHPETGGEAQKILNKQIVDKCDAAVAIFWTRFGTPTDEYHSGSEEEIERMIASGKNVFLYFSNVPVSLKSIDNEQYQKVKEYKAKFEKDKKGFYREYNSVDEFKEMFYDHISQYFSSLPKEEEITDEKKPELEVKLIDTEKDVVPDEPYKYKSPSGLITYRRLSEDDLFEDIADSVTIDDINAYNEALPPEEEVRAYNKELKLYEDAQNNCHDFKLSISNVGAAMAHEIYVDLELPEGILVYKEDATEDIDEPDERPKMPENPVWKAIEENEKKKYKSFYESIMLTEKLAQKMAGINALGFTGLNTSYASIPVASLKVPFSTKVDYAITDNTTLTLHIKDLLHTRQYSSDKFSLIFTSYGEFEIKYSVMCEEWEKPIEGCFKLKSEY